MGLDVERLHRVYEEACGWRRSGKTTARVWAVAHQADSGNLKTIAVLSHVEGDHRHIKPLLREALSGLGLTVKKEYVHNHEWLLSNGVRIFFTTVGQEESGRLMGISDDEKVVTVDGTPPLWCPLPTAK